MDSAPFSSDPCARRVPWRELRRVGHRCWQTSPAVTRSNSDDFADEANRNPDAVVMPSRPSDNRPSDSEVVGFLRAHHGADPTELEVLGGGFWSAAYGYRIGDDDGLVLRINDEPDGFRDDEFAMRYGSPALPVPEVFAIGEGFGRWFAISRRHRGRFLEEVGPDEADAVGPTVVELLAGLRSVPDTGVVTPRGATGCSPVSPTTRSPHGGVAPRLAADAAAERTFRAVDHRIRSLLDACPDRRELVHSDLLHYNVLVTPAADAVTAVFSWKCSTWGDAIYDLAWCTFWGRWHEGIGALDLWERVVPTLSASDALDVGVRHHVYELQIGASHLGWYATLGDTENLRWTLRQLDELLERGPRH